MNMSFFNELKRRNVFRVAIAYTVAAWLLLQIVDLVLENINSPDWVMQVFMLAMAVGLPITIIIAWAFEMTPEGIKLEKHVNRDESITRETGKHLNRGIIIILITLSSGKMFPSKQLLNRPGQRALRMWPYRLISKRPANQSPYCPSST